MSNATGLTNANLPLSQRLAVGSTQAAIATGELPAPPTLASHMNRTSSAGGPSLPESPLASSKMASGIGASPNPSPLVQYSGGWKSQFEGVPAIEIDPDEEELEEGSDNELYVLRASSSTDLIHTDSLYPTTSSTADVLMLSCSEVALTPRSQEKLKSKPKHTPNHAEELSAVASAISLSHSGDTWKATEVKKEWIDIQTSTFTNWVNDRLKVGKHDRRVENLRVDLKDGILLVKLLENLTKKKVAKFSGKTPKTEAHKIVNLDLAFKFLEAEDIKMIGVGAINVYQGNLTLILGMIWMLIQKYQIRMQGYKVSTKKVMIQWIQALLPKWNITNLTSDWRDGRALIAVINKVKPGIAPKVASLDPTKHRKNCAMATNIAHMHLKIPKIITVDDLSSGAVDELSMMTYLSYFVEPFRAKLLKWAQKVLPHFNITGFTSDWFDGQAFAALVDACFPDAVLHWPEQEGKDFVEHIFKIAKRKFGILPPFSALDLASGKVEEMQVMAMITLIKTGELQSLPEEVIVSGPGLGETQLHKETSFFVNTSEAGPGQLGIDAYYEEDGEKQKFSIKERKGRELLLAYTPIRTGKLMFDVTWSDEPVPLSPFVVSVVDSTLVKIVDFESHSRLVEVDKPLKLILDTKRAGKGRLNAYLLYGKKDKIQAMITPAANSRYRLDYTPTKSGSPVLHIFWNKQELAHLAIPYIVVDTGGYCVDSYPRDTVFCTFEEASFTILSSKGLPLDILQMTAVLDYDFQIPIKFSRIEGKKGFASFKPTMPGVYQVEVVCVDRLIQGSPFSVKVTDPTNCKVQGDLPAFLKLNVPHIFEIDTKEAGVGNITFEGTNCEISSLFRTNFQPYDASDLLKLEVTPIAEGDFVVGLKYHKHWIASCPFRLQVCDPRKFKMVEKLTMANVGKPINFTIEAKKVCRGELRPVITATGPSAQYSPQVTLSDDHLRYYVNFIPWEIGDHEIKVCYGTFHIPNSPIKIPVVSFNSNACSAAGSGLQRAYTNIPAQFVVLGKHTGLLENNTLHIKIASVVTGEECKVRVRDNKDGTYNVAYFIQKTGAYLLEIMTAGEHIPGSPFKLNALPGPEPSKCRIYGPALKEGAILTFGKPIDFTVDTTDAGIGKLSVKAVGPEGANARVFIAKTEKAGKYDIDIDALRHGKHRVSVKWSGQHVPNSPFLLKIFPGADASKCQAHGPGLEDGLVGKKSSFVIDTKNAGAGLLKVRLHGIKGAFKIEIQPVDQKNRRTLLAKYDPKQPGEYLIKIMWSDIHIPGSPFRVKITGEGVKKTAAIYTPTPRLPDAVALIEDDEEDSEDSATSQNPLKAILKSAPAIMHSMPPALKDTYHHGLKDKVKAPPHKQKMATFSHIQQMHRIGGSRSSVRTHKKRKRKNEFNGQVSIRMPSKAKSKYTQF